MLINLWHDICLGLKIECDITQLEFATSHTLLCLNIMPTSHLGLCTTIKHNYTQSFKPYEFVFDTFAKIGHIFHPYIVGVFLLLNFYRFTKVFLIMFLKFFWQPIFDNPWLRSFIYSISGNQNICTLGQLVQLTEILVLPLAMV